MKLHTQHLELKVWNSTGGRAVREPLHCTMNMMGIVREGWTGIEKKWKGYMRVPPDDNYCRLEPETWTLVEFYFPIEMPIDWVQKIMDIAATKAGYTVP